MRHAVTAPQVDVLWLVRHGNRQDFVDDDWHRTAERPHDPGLSPDGIEQAEATGAFLAGHPIRRIFTSPYLRCAQTAHLIARHIDAPVHIEPGLGELNDPGWTSEAPVLLSLPELAKITGEFDESHPPLVDPVYPETFEQAFARAAETAHALVERYPGPLVLVGHAVSVIGIVQRLTGYDGEIACDLASVTRLERRDVTWTLALHGETSHLPPPAQP